MQRLAARCTDCAFENPRGWVSCARCGALLGPRLRRDEARSQGDPLTAPTLKVVPPALTPCLSSDLESDEPTSVFGAPSAGSATSPRLPSPIPRAHRKPVDARPLIGQNAVIEGLTHAMETAWAEGHARLITVHGPSGSGKTLMLHRVSELAASMWPDISMHYAALRSSEDGPYAPFSRLLLERFGVTPASSPSAVRDDMARALAQAASEAEGSELAQLVAYVTGVPFPDGILLRELQAAPVTLHERAVGAVAQLVRADAQHTPVLWLIDDLTDAASTSLDLLAALLRLDVPLLVVATGTAHLRSRVATVDLSTRIAHIDLQPLAASDIDELARTLIPGLRGLPAELTEALVEHSLGNPRELVAMLSTLQAHPANGDA